MKSILVIGMGRFGRHLAKKMHEMGNEVMVVDKTEARIDQIAEIYADSYVGDCTNEGVLRSLGINNFDICFVTVGSDFQASLEITSLLSELGAKKIIAKAKEDRQAKFLKAVGASEVVYPEREIAEKLAVRCNADNIFDYIELTAEYSIYEIPAPNVWTGRTISELNIRQKYGITVIAVKNGNKINVMPRADYAFNNDDHVVVIGKSDDVFKVKSK